MGIYPTDIPRCWLGYLHTHRIYDNLLVADKLLKHNRYDYTKQTNVETNSIRITLQK